MDELEAQLSQMKAALQIASDDDKPALESIIKDLEELVNPVLVVHAAPSEIEVLNIDKDEEQDEYSLFQAEIAALDADSETTSSSLNGQSSSGSQSIVGSTESKTNPVNSISDELAALDGMKCLAPHEESWGQIGYYPAMISQVVSNSSSENDSDDDDNAVNSMDSIRVRVVFLQPVVKSQLFCPFFKEDRCRFSDDDCRYSHGEIVPLSSLREYSEPDYSKIVPDARVLAKYSDDLWYKATIIRLTEDGNCEVQYEKDDEPFELSMHETAPLSNDSEESSDSESDKDEEGQVNSTLTATVLYDSEQIMNMSATEALGDWEKYTKGFGSKLMMKMGYIMGSGLGKKSEGRINPVDAVIVPLGMSLDKYMEMKEKVGGGNKNWFSVEKRLKRAQKKHSDKEKQLAHQKKKQQPSMFEFINSHLGLRKNNKPISKAAAENIRKESSINLNKKMLHLGESMNKVTKDVRKVREAMKRLEGRDATTHAAMKDKLEVLEKQRTELQRMENNVAREQRHRSDKKKLVEF